MKNECAETILSIFRNEWEKEEEEEDEESDAISNGARRNERSKINKEVSEQHLEWKYVNGLIEFAMATYNQGSIIKRMGDIRDKYRKTKKELKQLQESIDSKIEDKVNEIITKDYDENLKQKVEYERELKVQDLQERVEVQSNMIQKLIKKNEFQYRQIEEYKTRPTKETYDDLQSRFDEYVNATRNIKKSTSTSSLSSNDDDSKYKKKYKALKKEHDKLQLQNLKLKQKIQSDNSDSSSSEDDV
jgi:hypothetical protein